ncbi:imidazole glycerol phosphate synthase subunit HisH [Spirulina sp. CCNP1310]|uniref:imidazole glycerol phosphate synthase subunit HisH n=1 Tax=Spirulina sp. CCNP1310 TaxID=3110249 RepID=UPI002B21E986|nr:imidazole glycerol phosphate synthase subunit HisH [Spirulina sp. CCNP1310]MEA5421196.1 imidazole glycerol phosphate synthase subunit HisH [Spirulina sp. CCNP1310]
MAKIAMIDYDMGNLHSAAKGLRSAGATVEITRDPTVIAAADGIVLPGVGAFDPAVQALRACGLEGPIRGAIASGKPFLGICLGLHLLFEGSEEGQESGLGILPGWVRRFHSEPGLTIPHMGWNQLAFVQPEHWAWQGLGDSPYVYFVHSYFVDPVDAGVRAAMVGHGSQMVTAAIASNNITAVQFHPEKSSQAGLQLLANFVKQVG